MPVWDYILCDWKGSEAVRLGLYAVTDLTKSPISSYKVADFVGQTRRYCRGDGCRLSRFCLLFVFRGVPFFFLLGILSEDGEVHAAVGAMVDAAGMCREIILLSVFEDEDSVVFE